MSKIKKIVIFISGFVVILFLIVLAHLYIKHDCSLSQNQTTSCSEQGLFCKAKSLSPRPFNGDFGDDWGGRLCVPKYYFFVK